jgi:hypothetical protein
MKSIVGGRNRTGVSRAPELAEEMVAAAAEFPPSSAGSADDLAAVRGEYARQAEPMGTMPPAGVGQLARTAGRALAGAQPVLLLDKLGERAAFERAGTRLYDAVLSKHDAGRNFRGGPSREDLQHVRDEEHQHFLMLGEAIRRLGGDPTVVTPSANLQATASKGLCAVLADPRTDVLQCLEALLTAELVDNDCWPALIELVENAGEENLAARFREARASEQEHLERVRSWLATGTGRSAERALEAGAETARGGSKPRQHETKRRAASSTAKKRASTRSRTNARGGGKNASRGRKTGRARRAR